MQEKFKRCNKPGRCKEFRTQTSVEVGCPTIPETQSRTLEVNQNIVRVTVVVVDRLGPAT